MFLWAFFGMTVSVESIYVQETERRISAWRCRPGDGIAGAFAAKRE